MPTPRPYRMAARADTVAATQRRITDAVITLAQERLTVEITLAEVARRAGTTVQTVLRHFGNRDALFDAAIAAGAAAVEAERQTPPGNIPEAIRVLVDHYEARGDFMVGMLGQEEHDARIRSFTRPGKALHRKWVADVFGAWLPDEEHAAAIIDLLVVATDLYTWKLLRRDRGLDRATTEARMLALSEAILATHTRWEKP